MKKAIIVVLLGLTLATPAYAQTVTATTSAFTAEQQSLINQLWSLVHELQRQLQVLLAEQGVNTAKVSYCDDLKSQIKQAEAEVVVAQGSYQKEIDYQKTNPTGGNTSTVYSYVKHYLDLRDVLVSKEQSDVDRIDLEYANNCN